jgi:hypothetical protein
VLPETSPIAQSDPVSPTATEARVPLPPPYTGPLNLIASGAPAAVCALSSPFELPARGVAQLSFMPSTKCSDGSSDLDLFVSGDRQYLAQRNHVGFRIVEVTDSSQPHLVGAWAFSPPPGNGHIKAFRQAGRVYLAIPLESPSPYKIAPCGIAIVEVTDPQAPILVGRYDGNTIGASRPWCNIHSVEIDTDADGNATFLLAGSFATADLYVLDIRDLNAIREVNAFHWHAHPHGDFGSTAHRATIAGNRVYLAYWGGGVIILDKQGLEAGAPPEAVALTSPGSIDPPDFTAHDTYPTTNGNFLFVNDMDRGDGIRLFDIRNLAEPREVWAANFDGFQAAHHTLQVTGELLIVPWFEDGVRVFRYDVSDPDAPIVDLVAEQDSHRIGEAKVGDCLIEETASTCVYASDERVGLVILGLPDN